MQLHVASSPVDLFGFTSGAVGLGANEFDFARHFE